jgi:hypothetical protein
MEEYSYNPDFYNSGWNTATPPMLQDASILQNFTTPTSAANTNTAKQKGWGWLFALEAIKQVGLPALAILKGRQVLQSENDLLNPNRQDAIGDAVANDPALQQYLQGLAAAQGKTLPEKPRNALIDFTSPVTYVVVLLVLLVLYLIYQNGSDNGGGKRKGKR